MWDGRWTPGVVVYVTVAGLLFVFSVLSMASIGIVRILPIPIAMFLGLLAWKRRWLVAGVVAAAYGRFGRIHPHGPHELLGVVGCETHPQTGNELERSWMHTDAPPRLSRSRHH